MPTTGIGGAGYTGTEKQLILRPRTYDPAATPHPCVFCWGHGNNATILANGVYWNGIGRAPADINDKPVISGDFGGDHWGRDDGITKFDALLTYYSTRGCDVSLIDLILISMGAPLGLNWAKANPTKVRKIVGVNPVIDIDDIHDNNRNSYAADIESAYTNLAGWNAAKATHSPAEYPASFIGMTMDLFYSTNDAIVIASTVTDFASASGATAHSLGAVNHSAGSLTPADVAALLA